MSKSFMHDFYFGHFIPWERGRSQDPDYTPINRKISDIKVYFRDKLSPEDNEKIEEMGNLRAQSSTIEDVDAFSYGMCMGMLLMMEVFDFKEKRMTDN